MTSAMFLEQLTDKYCNHPNKLNCNHDPCTQKFSAVITKFPRLSAHFSALFCAELFESQRISAHFLHKFRKVSRPG